MECLRKQTNQRISSVLTVKSDLAYILFHKAFQLFQDKVKSIIVLKFKSFETQTLRPETHQNHSTEHTIETFGTEI